MAGTGLADHYGVLEVDREADDGTVKKAYRRLVLKWHPDKHADKREVAEEMIRTINDAYETLGNPFKRGHYDQQLLAMERKARGYMLDTTSIKPRMSIPKEFMLSPMGHPEKFVRTLGTSIFVQSRKDTKSEFYDFFRDAKFSLWWLPEVNNMCRLRPTTTAGVGQDGGMNFSFALHRTVQVSEVILSPNTAPESVNVIAVASPIFKGAFRFEAAAFPGHYLAFKPPTHLRMVGGVVEETTAIDFLLVDYAKMFNYITAEEVLTPVVNKLGGDREYVGLHSIRRDSNVSLYFKSVLGQQIWDDEEFETFFESRSSEWEYDSRNLQVRFRPKHEQLANSLRRSRSMAEAAASISAADEQDAHRLPLETLEAVLTALSAPVPSDASVSYVINILDAQKKVLLALPKACERKRVDFKRILKVMDIVAAFGGDQPDGKVTKWKNEAAQDFGDLVSDQIRHEDIRDDVSMPILAKICNLPLPWRKCGEKLARLAKPFLEDAPLEDLLPLMKATVQALPASQQVAERFATAARSLLKKAEPAVAAEVLEVMVAGGLCLDSAPRDLERLLRSAPFGQLAGILASLGERGTEGEEMRECAAYIGKRSQDLEALPPPTLLRLTVAATKSSAVADKALDGVAGAAAMSLPGWSVDDASKLLLAVAKAKSSSDSEGVSTLYARASETLCQKLKEFSVVQLIKVVLAISKVEACRPLLVAAALEIATSRLGEVPSSQLLLFTQGILPLGDGHAALNLVLDFWTGQFNEASRAEDLLIESIGEQMLMDRRKDLESKGQLNADQLAKLAQVLAPTIREHEKFWKSLALRFVGQGSAEGLVTDLTSAGKSALRVAFPEGGGPDFKGKSMFLEVIATGKKPKEKKDKDRDREGGGGDDRGRERSRSRRDRDRDRDRARDRERDRDRDRRGERERRGGADGAREEAASGAARAAAEPSPALAGAAAGTGAAAGAAGGDSAAGAGATGAPPKGGGAAVIGSSSSSSSSSDSSSSSSKKKKKAKVKAKGKTAKAKAAGKAAEEKAAKRKAARLEARAKAKAAAKAAAEGGGPQEVEITTSKPTDSGKDKAEAEKEEQEKRKLMRERRAKLREEEAKNEPEQKRLEREKLEIELKEAEEKKKKEGAAEAEKRRQQAERRKARLKQQQQKPESPAVVDLDD